MSYVALLLFFVVEYVRPTSYVPALMVFKLNSLIPLAAFGGTLLTGTAAAAKDWVLADCNTKVVCGLLGLVFVSFLTADVQQFAWDRFTTVLGFAIIYWVLASELRTVGRIQGVFAMLVAVHVMVAALNPVMFTNPDERNYIASGAFLGDGNDFALSLCIVVPLCLFLFLNARVVLRPAWMVCLFLLTACVVLTQSRGGTLGLGAMGVYYWLKNPKKAQTGAMVLVAVGLILVFAPGAYFNRIRTIADTQEGSASGRIMAWGVAVDMALSNPVLGVGAGHFPTKFGNEFRPKDLEGPSMMTAHSIYFLALGELGVPGLAILIYFIGANLSANRRLAIEVRDRHGTKAIELQLLASTSAAVIAFAVAGAFLSALYYPHLYVIAGLQAAVREVVRQRCLGAGVAAPAVIQKPEIWIHPALRSPKPAASAVARVRQ